MDQSVYLYISYYGNFFIHWQLYEFGVPKPTLKFGYISHIDKSDQKSVVEQLANATKYSEIQTLDGAI